VNLWRHQVPANSPVSAGAVLAGLGAVVRNGKASAQSEARVIELLSARYAPRDVVLTDSGTTALSAALLGVLKDRPGAPVALPAYACYDIATAADGAGARVLLYDLDPHTLAPDMAQLRAALRQGAAAVVIVHAYGYPVDVGEVQRLAAETGAVTIEDAAQAAGASLNGRAAGTTASLAVLSFGRGKGLTGGSGGAVLAHDDAGARIVERARSLLDAPRRGWPELLNIAAQLVFQRPSLYALPAAVPFLHLGETIYRKPKPMRRATNVSGRVVAATWRLAESEARIRRRNAERLLRVLRWERGFETVHALGAAQPGYLRLPVLASPAARPLVDQPAARRLGVMPGYPKPLSELPSFGARCVNREADFPGSRLLAERLCTLPTHGRLGARDLERLEAWIRSVGR